MMATMNNELIVLVHGFFRTYRHMAYLEAGLREAGYRTFSARLPALLRSLDDCAAALGEQIVESAAGAGRIHFVAHSMGGLIVREHLYRAGCERVGRCVFIATPHRGSTLADIFGRVPLLGRVMRPLADLTPAARAAVTPIGADVDIGLLAGTDNNLLLGKWFLSPESDGRVELASVGTEDARELLALPLGHNDIHHHPRTLALVQSFLRSGRFEPAALPAAATA